MSRVDMQIRSPREPDASSTGISAKSKLDAELGGEREGTSLNNGSLGRKEYLLVCLATAIAGSPTLGIMGALFLPLSTITEAPLFLAAGAGLFTAALVDLGRSALLSSEVLQSGELLGAAVYLSSFVVLSSLKETTVGDAGLESQTSADIEQARSEDKVWDGSDLDDKKKSDTVVRALQDWDARLDGGDKNSRRQP